MADGQRPIRICRIGAVSVNEIMARYFEQPYPARAALGVRALPKGAEVEADAILAA